MSGMIGLRKYRRKVIMKVGIMVVRKEKEKTIVNLGVIKILVWRG